MGGRAHRAHAGAPVPRRAAPAPRGAVLEPLRARPCTWLGSGPRKCQSGRSAPAALSQPRLRVPLPRSTWPPGPSYWLESCGPATAEGKPERGHPGHRAAGLGSPDGGHAGMAGRRGQGGSLPPQDLLLRPGHPGSAEIHPRCAPCRAPCSPGSQEKFGRGRSGEGRQPRGLSSAAGDPW